MKTSLQKAKLVITQRLHIALPAASMGTPVILILDDNLPGGGGVNGNSRFSGLQAAVHTVNIHSFKATAEAIRMLHTFDWDSPPPNPSPETIAIRRNALQVLTMCHGTDLFDSGRKFGIVPSTWKYPFEQTGCNNSTDQKSEDEEVIHRLAGFVSSIFQLDQCSLQIQWEEKVCFLLSYEQYDPKRTMFDSLDYLPILS
jgi:hypothetical protein